MSEGRRHDRLMATFLQWIFQRDALVGRPIDPLAVDAVSPLRRHALPARGSRLFLMRAGGLA